MLNIEQYDDIEMIDGTEGCVVEVFKSNVTEDDDMFLVDIGDDPYTWQTISIGRKDIKRVIKHN